MIITYSHERFPALIKAGIKIHTIRKRGRWKAGMKMHHWMHSPRHPHKNPYCFLENVCTGTQPIVIRPQTCAVYLDVRPSDMVKQGLAYADLKKNYKAIDVSQLGINDGFVETPGLIWKWFDEASDDMEIVHWTDFRY